MAGGYWMRLCGMFGFISQDWLGNGRGRKVFTFVGCWRLGIEAAACSKHIVYLCFSFEEYS